MIDFESHCIALKAAWVPRILNDSDNIWTYIGMSYISKATGGLIKQMTILSKKQFPRLEMVPAFYQEIIVGYCKANIPDKICTKSDIFNQVIWGNRQLHVQDKCIYSQSFIDAGYVYIRDLLLDNGKLNPNIYDMLRGKQQYLRTISLVQHTLKPYKAIRFCDDTVNIHVEQEKNLNNKKCNWFYGEILKQKAVKPRSMRKWLEYFEVELSWKSVYLNKLKDQLEVKIAEFNYKLLNNILPTGCNLYKWKKAQDASCVYCNADHHDANHLFVNCPHLDNFWDTVSCSLQENINWQTIVLGTNGQQYVNLIVSLLCFIIYKKMLLDKNDRQNIYMTIQSFVKKELVYRLKVYKETECPRNVRLSLETLLDAL